MSKTLEIGPVSVRYGKQHRVNTAPLRLHAGQFVGLLGPNGAGKSSWLKALIGAVPASVSALTFGGQDLHAISPRDKAKTLAYLSQTRIGPPLASVRDVIALGRHPHFGADPTGRAAALIERLELGPIADRAFGTLSGGEQARVLLARALAVDAPVLLADEPIAALDPYYAHQILSLLKDEAARGTLIIASLHDLGLTEQYCGAALIMDHGTICAQGDVNTAMDDNVLRQVFKIERTPTGFAPLSFKG